MGLTLRAVCGEVVDILSQFSRMDPSAFEQISSAGFPETDELTANFERPVKEGREGECVVSFQACLPSSLQASMSDFIERYPNWDQYRLIKAALAGFLVQNGVESRQITRLYVGNMFASQSLAEGN